MRIKDLPPLVDNFPPVRAWVSGLLLLAFLTACSPNDQVIASPEVIPQPTRALTTTPPETSQELGGLVIINPPTVTAEPLKTARKLSNEQIYVFERYKQTHALSCEFAAIHTALTMFGKKQPSGYQSWEEFLVDELNKKDGLVIRDSDPNIGFVGNIDGSQEAPVESGNFGYGIYAGGFKYFLKHEGINYEIINNSDLADLRRQVVSVLENNGLVIAWGTNSIYGNSSDPLTIETNGQKLILGEHAIVILSYSPQTNQITFLDTFTGEIYKTDSGDMPIPNMQLFDHLALYPSTAEIRHWY